jgi:CHAT domain-containing protein
MKKWLLFFLGLFFTIKILPGFSQVGEGQQLVFKGEQAYQAGELSQAVDFYRQAVDVFQRQGDRNLQNLAITSSNLCRLQIELGQAEEATKSCQVSIDNYSRLNDRNGLLRSRVYQASALQKLGLSTRACDRLIQGLQVNSSNCNNLSKEVLEREFNRFSNRLNPIQITAWRSLGDSLRFLGKLEESEIILERINTISSGIEKASTLLSLGNTLTARGNLERDRQAEPLYNYLPWNCQSVSIPEEAKPYYDRALNFYEQAANFNSNNTTIKAKLNHLNLSIQLGKIQEAKNLAKQINYTNLPKSQGRVYAEINYAKNLACLQQNSDKNTQNWSEIIENVEIAIQEAKEIKDNLTESYAVGNLGGLYEYLGRLEEAKKFTQEALYLAQPSQAPHIAYQWQWQLGRLYEKQGNREKAIATYEEAAKTLASVRQDLLAINSDVQFSFRDNVEPFYRELVSLLLLSPEKNEDKFSQSIYYIESLNLAELENFLQCDLQEVTTDSPIATLTERLNEVIKYDPTAAIIYPILLKDSLEILFLSADQPLQHKTVRVSASQVNDIVRQIRQDILTPIQNNRVRTLSQQIYNWLIEPIETELARQKRVKNLVFVLDSFFQNIPLAAIYDGQDYLIKKYAIAVVPSLQLLDINPSPTRQIDALLAGATNAPSFRQENLTPLPNVERELKDIGQEIGGGTTLFEQNFLQSNMRSQIAQTPFSIVHIATHGSFSSNPEQTYLLDWNKRINIEDLNDLLRVNRDSKSQPIDLLILSACETASGDRRAALGLAGIAIRAGVRTTVATLWQISDASTAEFMVQFYENLKNPQLSKIEALRRTQLTFLENSSESEYNRAYYWAPFVMVGDWL